MGGGLHTTTVRDPREVFPTVSAPRLPQSVKDNLMTYDEMKKEIEVLTSEIRTLSYSSTKEAAEKILQLQRRRRELRAQLEAAES